MLLKSGERERCERQGERVREKDRERRDGERERERANLYTDRCGVWMMRVFRSRVVLREIRV